MERAARHDLLLEGLDGYRLGVADQPPSLVVGYGTPPGHGYTGALARLTAVLRRQCADPMMQPPSGICGLCLDG